MAQPQHSPEVEALAGGGLGLTLPQANTYDSCGMLAPTGEHSPSLSFGEILRRERELRRIPLRDVSEATKINIRYLEALERNEFDFLPAGAFTRGFVRSYARFIGTDENEMINAYLYEVGQQDKLRKGAPGRETVHAGPLFGQRGVAAARPRRRLWLLVGAGLLVLLIAAAVLVAPRLWHRKSNAPSAAPPGTTESRRSG
jgi:cytoskeletal protein RodZ